MKINNVRLAPQLLVAIFIAAVFLFDGQWSYANHEVGNDQFSGVIRLLQGAVDDATHHNFRSAHSKVVRAIRSLRIRPERTGCGLVGLLMEVDSILINRNLSSEKKEELSITGLMVAMDLLESIAVEEGEGTDETGGAPIDTEEKTVTRDVLEIG